VGGEIRYKKTRYKIQEDKSQIREDPAFAGQVLVPTDLQEGDVICREQKKKDKKEIRHPKYKNIDSLPFTLYPYPLSLNPYPLILAPFALLSRHTTSPSGRFVGIKTSLF